MRRRGRALDRSVGGTAELTRCPVAVTRRLRHRGSDDVVERSRELGPDIRQPRRRLVQVGEDDREVALTLVRTLAGDALEEHTAERVEVARASTEPPRICSGAT